MCMTEAKINLSKFRNALSRKYKLIRVTWNVEWTLFAYPMKLSMCRR